MKIPGSTFILLCCFFLSSKESFATIDSLKTVFYVAKTDSLRCIVLSKIASDADEDIWPPFNYKLYKIAKQNLATAKNEKEKRFYGKYLADAINNFGYLSDYKGDIHKAFYFYFQSLKIEESINDSAGIAITLSSIGFLYKNQGEYAKAIEYYNKALLLEKDRQGIAYLYNNLGGVYHTLGNADKALNYYYKTLEIAKQINDDWTIASTLRNIGQVHLSKHRYEEAKPYMDEALVFGRKAQDKTCTMLALNGIAEYYLQKNDAASTRTALKTALESHSISSELGFPVMLERTANTLKRIYHKLHNPVKELEMFELYISMRDSITSEKTRKDAKQQLFKYEWEKREAQLKATQDKKDAIADEERKKQRIVLVFISAGLALVVLFSFFLFKRFRLTQQQKQIIESQKEEVDRAYQKLHEKNKEILDSIHYAARIQRALLTPLKYIGRQLSHVK